MTTGVLSAATAVLPYESRIPLAQRGAGAVPILTARLVVVLSNALLLFCLSRVLDTTVFGRFAAMIGASLFAARLIMFGCDFSTLRLFAHADAPMVRRELAGAAAAVLAGGSLFIVLATGAIAVVIEAYTDNWPLWLLTATCIGGIGTALVDYTYAFRLARHQYARAAVLHACTAMLRFAAILAIIPITNNKRMLFWTYALITGVSGVLQMLVTVVPNFSKPGSSAIRAMLAYSGWQATSMAVGIFSAYQGVYLLSIRHAPRQAGIAGLAVVLCAGVYVLYQGLAENLTIRALQLRDSTHLSAFLKRTTAHCVLLAAICYAGVIAVFFVGRLLFHSAVWADGRAFLLYGLSAVIVLIHAPAEAIAHHAMKPSWILWNKVFRSAMIGLIGLASLPTAIGVARAQLGGTLVAFVPFLLLVIFAAAHGSKASSG